MVAPFSSIRTAIALSAALLAAAALPAAAADFAVDFVWGATPACNTGAPGIVTNPAFRVTGVPPGTHVLEFRMIDLNAPAFQHGGGQVKYNGQAIIAPGAFSYRGPCPPKGRHRYAWEVTAKDRATTFGHILGTARAIRSFPGN